MYFLGNKEKLNGREFFLKVYSEFPVNRGLELPKVRIGTHSAISKILFWEDFKSTTSLPLVLTLFLITIFFTLFIYVQKSHKTIHLWAAATSLLMASYTFFLSRYGYELNISNLLNYRTLVSSAMMITICLVAFSYSLSKSKVSRILLPLGVLNFFYLLYIQTFNSILQFRAAYKYWFFLFIVIVVVMIFHFFTLAQKNSRAKFMLIGTIIFFGTAVNDITITLGLRSGVNIAQYGLASFAVVFLLSEIYELFSEIKKSALSEAESKTKKAVALAVIEQNAQVAHDIRSPLAALDMAVEDLAELPEDMRLLIRGSVSRIKDIANHLVKNAHSDKIQDNSQHTQSEKKEVHLLSSLIESLVSEKRMQLRSQIGIEIESKLNAESYGLFCELKAQDLKRVLSNLINNASEAIGNTGIISITIRPEKNFSIITITDNGRGIPGEILPTLMKRGNTYGKSNGSGLGLFHAKSVIEELGGHISIESTNGIGTTIKLLIPFCDPPDWFVPNLKIDFDSIICVLDDDASIHQIWKERFERTRKTFSDIKIQHFSNVEEATNWINKNNNSKTIYLVDYEFFGLSANGLEFIEKLNLASQAILVTSHYEEPLIRNQCKKIGVKLIPKGLAGFVPIIQEEYLEEKIVSILIDDDPLIRLIWEKAAQSNGIELKVFQDILSFREIQGTLDFYSNIYIDSNLKNLDRGEVFAKELFDIGFKNIILTTGYDPARFENHPYFKKIMGKTPPWSICKL
ncbi:MAG: sensor histidine kinase [Bacteriovorax sp.]|nr:sensor histidine kinase [Bacteriovorax sp.]